MAYRHGVYVSEVPTSLLPMREVYARLPFVVGTAPVDTLPAEAEKPVNKPVLCFSLEEYVAAFGSTTDPASYTLAEAAEVFFKLYRSGPVVFVNVYDPAAHAGGVGDVTAADIIGGIDGATGKKTGLELVDSVFPMFRKVPGQILAPGFSQDPTVAVVMAAKAVSINAHFKATALADVPVAGIDGYTAVPGWKNTNNYTDEHMVVCWPKVRVGNHAYWLSCHAAALAMEVDAGHEDIPFVSPSNHRLSIIGADHDGEELFLGPEQANYLNSEGIVTALNFDGGWKLWGNRTGVYPSVTDVKDSFWPIRSMFNWLANTLTLTYWQKVDYPLRRREIHTIVDSANIWLNGLAAREVILGGRCAFLESENPITDLMDGIARFHVYWTPPSPMRDLEFITEYDPRYLATLFE